MLAILGAIALLLTALAAAVRLAPNTFNVIKGDDSDRPILVADLVIYAVMGAISFYEKGIRQALLYFRQLRPDPRHP